MNETLVGDKDQIGIDRIKLKDIIDRQGSVFVLHMLTESWANVRDKLKFSKNECWNMLDSYTDELRLSAKYRLGLR